jgi:hypothetical protein
VTASAHPRRDAIETDVADAHATHDGDTPAPAWDAESVLAASTEWAWVPDAAPHVHTAEYLVVAYPTWFLHRTGARVFGSDRDPEAIVEEVHGIVRGWGRDRVWWWVSDVTRPAGLEPLLLARGAAVVERADVLGLPLAAGVPDLALPRDVQVRRVDDEATLRDSYAVSHDAFGGDDDHGDEQVETGLAEVRRGLGDDSGGRFVGYVDGRPAATGGWTMAGPVCRLWGGCSHGELRGRGAYRAVLAARLHTARAAGATLALTHGGVDTWSPILRRMGFTRYGENRELVVDLPPEP